MKKTGSLSRVLFFGGLALSMGAGTGAWAGQAVPLETSEEVGDLDSSDYPRISTAYGRSNDVISITLDYLTTTAQSLEAAQDDDEKRKILGPFCLQVGAGAQQEPVESCEKRFRWYAASAASRAKLAIATNNESSEQLKSNSKHGGIAREMSVPKGAQAPAATKKPNVLPYVPRYGSLQAEQAARAQSSGGVYQPELEKYLASPEFEAEVRRSLKPMPSEDDFVVMVKRSGDGDENSWVPQRDAQGRLVKDRKKYIEALKEYNDSMNGVQLVPDQQLEAKEVSVKKEMIRDEMRRFATQGAPALKDPKSRESLIKRNYDFAHDGAVDSINDKLAGKKDDSSRQQKATTGSPVGVGEKKVVQSAERAKDRPFESTPYAVDTVEQIRQGVLKPVTGGGTGTGKKAAGSGGAASGASH